MKKKSLLFITFAPRRELPELDLEANRVMVVGGSLFHFFQVVLLKNTVCTGPTLF